MLNLTDAEIARVFSLTDEIARVKQEIPAPPRAFAATQAVNEEIARASRESLEKHLGALLELCLLLDKLNEEN